MVSLVIKPQDIVVMMKIASEEEGWTLDEVAESLGMSLSALHRSIRRGEEAELYDRSRRRINAPHLHEFLVHAAKYVFPGVMLGEARGIPTAWAAPPLSTLMSSGGSNRPVWPHPLGEVRGIGLRPLHPIVAEAARRDARLGEGLALLDAIRIGNAREREIAAAELADHLRLARADA